MKKSNMKDHKISPRSNSTSPKILEVMNLDDMIFFKCSSL